MNNNTFKNILLILLLVLYLGYNYFYNDLNDIKYTNSYNINEIPKYNGNKYIYINDNIPFFNEDELTTKSFEIYSNLDSLGRAGVAYANIGEDLMPTKEREDISKIKPSGWHYTKYDFIEDKYLYNRCHLIAYMLTGEDLNKENLITCTDMLNKEIMLEYEKKVFNYIKKTHNHVHYRVTPIYENDNLIATGIEIEALSIEDNGEGIKFNMFFYNIEDGVEINYLNGESKLVG